MSASELSSGRGLLDVLDEIGAGVNQTGGTTLSAQAFRSLLDFALERGYLEGVSQLETFPEPESAIRPVAWMRLQRLPVHPTQVEEYDLLARWQNVLGTLHTWRHRLVFLLVRHQGETRIYLGAASPRGTVDVTAATAQLRQAAVSQMPGIELTPLARADAHEVASSLLGLTTAGAVTGLPSPRDSRDASILQTLDQVAFGIHTSSGRETDYALVVVADPVPDPDIAAAIHRFRGVGSAVHGAVKRTVSTGSSRSTEASTPREVSMWAAVGTGALALGSLLPQSRALVRTAMPFLGALGIGVGLDLGGETAQVTSSQNESTETLDKVAQYCEFVVDRHVTRLQQGRNLGYWNVGVYVLAQSASTVQTVTGMLRSVYSGQESYIEPIRVHLFQPGSGAVDWIERFEHIPFPADVGTAGPPSTLGGVVDPLGLLHSGVTTPLNTAELSIATSLPRRDVPGLRFVRNAVRFATNPPVVAPDSADTITLGSVMDNGVPLGVSYAFDANTLVRHALVTGVTGSGKSTTCRRLIAEVLGRGLPVLVVEPAKEEYVEWALAYNEKAPEDRRIRVYMPGAPAYFADRVLPLRLNPFEPAAFGDTADYVSRFERFSAVLTASLPMADVLPLLLEEAIYRHLQNQIDVDFADGDRPVRNSYPRLEGVALTAQRVIEARGYEARVRDNLIAAVKTRIGALCRGKRGGILNVERSTPFADLFDRPAVVNLSQIVDDRDKALIMALLVTALHEYRVSRYRNDGEFKAQANRNRLLHLTVIEEAHRLLANPQRDASGIGNPQAVTAGMFSEMLSEIRAYGEGLLVVDQVPSRLIPDAIKNTNLKIVHRLISRDDREAMSGSMALRPDQEGILATLGVGETVLCSDHDDAAAWVLIRRE